MKNQVNIRDIYGNLYIKESAEQKVDSIVNSLLTELSLSTIAPPLSRKRNIPSKVIKKVEHNNLVTQRFILSQYQNFSTSIETAYEIIDTNIVNGKAKVFLMLDNLYMKALCKVGIDPNFDEVNMEIIRQHADDIIESIINGLKEFCYESSNVPSDKESIEIGVNVIVAHAFVECTVLENPNAPL